MSKPLIEFEQGDGWAAALIGGRGGEAKARSFLYRVKAQASAWCYRDKASLPKKVWCVEALGLTGSALEDLWVKGES